MHTASELRRYHGQVSATIKLGGKFINITRNKAKFEFDNYTVGRKADRVLQEKNKMGRIIKLFSFSSMTHMES